FAWPAVLELETGARGEVFDRLGAEDLSRAGFRGNASAHVNSNSRQFLCRDLALARMEATSKLEPQRPHGISNRTSAPDRTRWTVEAGKDTVPQRCRFLVHGTAQARDARVRDAARAARASVDRRARRPARSSARG